MLPPGGGEPCACRSFDGRPADLSVSSTPNDGLLNAADSAEQGLV